MSLTFIETKTLLSAAASIEFTSIPQDFTDLLVLTSTRADNTDVIFSNQEILFNGSSAGFSGVRLIGSGLGTNSTTVTNRVGLIASNAATANTFGNVAIYIPNYTSSTNKSYSVDSVGENNATESYQEIIAGLWSNTAAITSVTMKPQLTRNFVTGTTISLYGITKGSDGIVTTS
jgi:hypothetical protein